MWVNLKYIIKTLNFYIKKHIKKFNNTQVKSSYDQFEKLLLIVVYIKLRERKHIRDKQILEQMVRERTAEIEQQKEEIQAQRDEIEDQRDQIEADMAPFGFISDGLEDNNVIIDSETGDRWHIDEYGDSQYMWYYR